MSESNDQTSGVLGASTPTPTKPDCKLIELAIRENWPIPDAARAAMIAQLAGVVSEPEMIKKKPRLYLACSKALMTLSRLNLTAVDTMIRATQADDQEERIAELERNVEASRNRGMP